MKILTVILVASACICGCSAPEDESAAESALRQEVEGQSQGAVKLVSFTKTDGKSMDFGGMKTREVDYTAEVEFEQNGTWLSGGYPGRLGFRFTTTVQKSKGATMDLLNSFDGPVRVSQGSRAEIAGAMGGTKNDNGWQFQTTESHLVTPLTSR